MSKTIQQASNFGQIVILNDVSETRLPKHGFGHRPFKKKEV